jgi:hypothetical protein
MATYMFEKAVREYEIEGLAVNEAVSLASISHYWSQPRYVAIECLQIDDGDMSWPYRCPCPPTRRAAQIENLHLRKLRKFFADKFPSPQPHAFSKGRIRADKAISDIVGEH